MKNLRYNGNISSMQWQNGASAAKSGYKFSYETVVDYASLPYVVAGYYYYTQDHLGNNRAVIDEGGNVKQVTNYYPFGGVFSTTAYNHGDDFQPYKYNGNELDRTHGLDWYDYGARNYDATRADHRISRIIDPGLGIEKIIRDEKGKYHSILTF